MFIEHLSHQVLTPTTKEAALVLPVKVLGWLSASSGFREASR